MFCFVMPRSVASFVLMVDQPVNQFKKFILCFALDISNGNFARYSVYNNYWFYSNCNIAMGYFTFLVRMCLTTLIAAFVIINNNIIISIIIL